jgi:hypothetical protein
VDLTLQVKIDTMIEENRLLRSIGAIMTQRAMQQIVKMIVYPILLN